MAETGPPLPPEDPELAAERMSRTIAAYVDRLNAGERIDPLEIIANHPDDGERILERLEAFVGFPGGGEREPLAQDLRRFVRGDAIEARPQPAWEMLARRAWRRRQAAAVLLLAGLLVLALGIPEGDRAGYAIPLPRGRYRVTLHFAEIWFAVPGMRRFDVRIEGSEVLREHEPLSKGFLAADARSFEVEVRDGTLDIEFVRRVEDPAVSGLEIEASGRS